MGWGNSTNMDKERGEGKREMKMYCNICEGEKVTRHDEMGDYCLSCFNGIDTPNAKQVEARNPLQ